MALAEVMTMELTLSRTQVTQYGRDNRYAVMMFMSASDDYCACRCCILNMLSAGFRLASEAIEKMLKAFIYLQTGSPTKLKRNDKHTPYLLKQELGETYHDQRLDSFDLLLRRLFDHYQTRYFDNPRSGEGASSEELPQIDDLFIYLVQNLPMPDEVKYRSKFFADLFDSNARKYWRNHHWLVEQNLALHSKMKTMEDRYQHVLMHLYPSALQKP